MKTRFLFLALTPFLFAGVALSAPGDNPSWTRAIDDDDLDFDSLRSWNGSFAVRGEFRSPRETVTASRLRLNLLSTGYFTASVDAARGGRDGNFRGQWSRQGREIQLRIDNVNGYNASGTGRITFSGRGRNLAIDQIEFDGRTRGGLAGRDAERVSADLRASDSEEAVVGKILRPRRVENGRNNDNDDDWRDRWNNRPGTGSLDQLFSTKSGQGTLRVENQRSENNLREARIELSRNGRAQIRLLGSREWNFEGRWRQDGRERIDLQLDGASSASNPGILRAPQSSGLGRGTIWLNGTSFSRLYLTGSLGRDEFRADFDVNGRGNDWPGGGRPGGGWPGNDWPGGGWPGDDWNDDRPSNEVHSGVFRTFTASGSIRLGNEPTDYAQRVRVELRRDRSAFIEIIGQERFYVLRGTWTPDGSGDYKLELRPQDGYDRITGEVGTQGNTNNVDGLDLSGRFDNRSFSAYLTLN